MQPDIYQLLLSIVSGNDVLTPLLALMIVLHKKQMVAKLKGPFGVPLFWIFVLLFLMATAASLVFSLKHYPYVPYIGPAAFLLSSATACWIYKRKGAA
jgi:hypothetical protein